MSCCGSTHFCDNFVFFTNIALPLQAWNSPSSKLCTRVSWKKSTLFFWLETNRYAENAAHRRQIYSYKSRWTASLQPGRNSVDDESAWLTFAAIDYLQDWLKPEHRVFEYGGGGSTLFFCQRAAFVATVENNKDWFQTLTAKLREKGYQNWEGYYAEGEPLTDPAEVDIANPNHFASAAPSLENHSFERYAKTIDHYPEATFDLILVDGRSRPACVQAAIPHLKSGGLLVLDNAERPYYTAAFKQVFADQFEVIMDQRFPCVYVPQFTITLILKKK